MALTALFGFLGGGVPGAIANTARYAFDDDARNQFARGPEIERTRGNIQRELLTRKQATDSLNDQSLRDLRETQVENIRRRPEIEANKAEEQHRRTLASLYNRLPEFDPADPANADLVDAMTEARLPVVPKSRANQLRFVQDARTGEWKVISGNRSTGEATGRAIGSEGGTLTTTPNVQIASEDRAAGRESRERVATLNRQSREAIAELNRRARASGGRGNAREEARLTRAVQEITDLENLKTDAISGPVQGRTSALEKAATKAAEIRRLYGDLVDVGYGGDSEGRQWPYAKMKQQGAQGVQQSGAIGRAPASDGKHHYTKAEIRAQAEAADVSYESLYNKLRTNQKVVIEQ